MGSLGSYVFKTEDIFLRAANCLTTSHTLLAGPPCRDGSVIFGQGGKNSEPTGKLETAVAPQRQLGFWGSSGRWE